MTPSKLREKDWKEYWYLGGPCLECSLFSAIEAEDKSNSSLTLHCKEPQKAKKKTRLQTVTVTIAHLQNTARCPHQCCSEAKCHDTSRSWRRNPVASSAPGLEWPGFGALHKRETHEDKCSCLWMTVQRPGQFQAPRNPRTPEYTKGREATLEYMLCLSKYQ